MSKQLQLIDPNKTKLNPMWIAAVATALSRKYNVTVKKGEYWAMDIDNRIMTYNDSIMSLHKDDAMALILHEIGHLIYTDKIDQQTDIYKLCPESSMAAVNNLEDFRIDFLMAHEYANSGHIIQKFNEHSTGMALEKLSQLQSMQKEYDHEASKVLQTIEQKTAQLQQMGTPHRVLDDTEKFMQVVNRLGYRPRFKRPIEEVFMLATLLYHTESWDTPEKKWGEILAKYQNPDILELAKKIVPVFKYKVEHLDSTVEVQRLWEDEIYPILKDMIEKDKQQPQHQAATPQGGGEAMIEMCGGQESEGNNKPGMLNGQVQIDPNTGRPSIKGYGSVDSGMSDEQAKQQFSGDQRGSEVTKAESKKQSMGYTKKAQGTNRQVSWEHYKNEIKQYVSTAKTQLNRSLKENMYNRYTGRHGSGKLNIKKLYKFPMRDFKLFQRKGDVKDKDYAFSILVDISGSMEGPRLSETMKGVVLMAETLNKINQPVEITFFSSQHTTPKKFHTIIDPIEIGYQATKVIGGGTDILFPFNANLESLLKQPTHEKIMITLTDGDFGGNEKNMIRQLQEKHKNVLHYGIGIDVNLSDVFPGDRAINIKNVSQIMPAFAGILRRHIKK